MNLKFMNKIEQKYILDSHEYNELMKVAKHHLKKDYYYKSTICNVYFDTANSDLIVDSLGKAPFKEKIILKSYKVPKINDQVFLEISREYDGKVTSRRIKVNLKDFYNYLLTGIFPKNNNNQIMKEIDYAIRHYNLRPMLFLAYERISYIDKDNKNFKITFDKNMRSRKEDLHLEGGDAGKLYFNEPKYIMELKSHGYLPLWFTKLLSTLNIYPRTFSKYGSILG